MIDDNVMFDCLEILMKTGGEYADIFCEDRQSLSIILDDNKIDEIINGNRQGIGIRLIHNLKTYYAYGNNLSDDEIITLCKSLTNAIDKSHPAKSITEIKHHSKEIGYIKKHPSSVPVGNKVKMLKDANRVARSSSLRIKQVKAIYSEMNQDVKILTSDANLVTDKRLYISAMIHTVAMDNSNIQTGVEAVGGTLGFEIFDDTPLEQISLTAANRAVMMLDAPRIKGGRMPVVISSSAGGTMIHEAVGHGLEADLAMQGLSVFTGRIGQTVASPIVTVIDDATLLGKRGSYNFDDEGTPSSRTVLIKDGVLVSYLCDRYNAIKYGLKPTGNGRRQSFESRPIVRMTNTFIQSGKDNPDDIVKSTPKGLFVKKMGGGQVNTVTGDFVFDVQEGYVIENGSIGNAVRGVTLIGNCLEVLSSIDMVGWDLGFSIGSCGKDGQSVPVSDAMPTVRIGEMVVGGISE
ncbi:MAG: TldD/PmbA family protein [Thermodesulfovibrionales bacterium]|nr:TldD/PmbA family protein [Thermodesulfovibrionales bacterium]